jgi:DNA modification methylase
MSQPFTPTQTDQDRAEVAKFKAMLAERRGKDRTWCIGYGKAVALHLERKELPKGQTNAYSKAAFGLDWDYIKLFVKLYYLQNELGDADKAQAERHWVNAMTSEPRRSLSLVNWFLHTSKKSGSTSAPSRAACQGSDNKETDHAVLVGDCRTLLHGLEPKCFQACVTSPPYLWLMDYGMPEQIGQEATVSEYFAVLARDVFSLVWQALADDGVLWVVIGDHVAGAGHACEADEGRRSSGEEWRKHRRVGKPADDLPAGNLRRVPERLAAALVNNGWVYRCEVIWEKDGVTSHGDKRPQPTHEKVMLFTKSMKYRFHQDAVQQPTLDGLKHPGAKARSQGQIAVPAETRDLGTVWRIPTASGLKGMGAFPVELVRRLMLYATLEGERVLDPFGGTGTTGVVAKMLKRRSTLMELNPEFAANAATRIENAPDHFPPAAIPTLAQGELDLLRESLIEMTAERDMLRQPHQHEQADAEMDEAVPGLSC